MITLFAGLILTVLLMPLLLRLAPHVGLLDHPDERKHHHGAVPVVGGIGIFMAISINLLWLAHAHNHHPALLLTSIALVFGIGLLDDWKSVSVHVRFLVQGAAAMLMIGFADLRLDQLGDLFGSGPVLIGIFAVPFTLFAVVGVANAYNLMDGLDGLAGGLALIAAAFLAVAALSSGLIPQFEMLMLFIGALVGFLFFNMRLFGRKRARVFMGDSGSLMVGFIIAWFAVDATQGNGRTLTPVVVLWFLAIPLWDTVSLMVRRVLKGESPFHPGHDHLHHILQRAGYSHCQVVFIILALAFVLAMIGLVGWWMAVPQYQLFFAFLSLFFIYLFGVQHAWKLMKFMKKVHSHS